MNHDGTVEKRLGRGAKYIQTAELVAGWGAGIFLTVMENHSGSGAGQWHDLIFKGCYGCVLRITIGKQESKRNLECL